MELNGNAIFHLNSMETAFFIEFSGKRFQWNSMWLFCTGSPPRLTCQSNMCLLDNILNHSIGLWCGSNRTSKIHNWHLCKGRWVVVKTRSRWRWQQWADLFGYLNGYSGNQLIYQVWRQSHRRGWNCWRWGRACHIHRSSPLSPGWCCDKGFKGLWQMMFGPLRMSGRHQKGKEMTGRHHNQEWGLLRKITKGDISKGKCFCVIKIMKKNLK